MSELWKIRSETEARWIADEGLKALLRQHSGIRSIKIAVRFSSGEVLATACEEVETKVEK